jgi:hypothetical protein
MLSSRRTDVHPSGVSAMSKVCLCIALSLTVVASAAFAEEKKDDKGWIQLFNGKDLTGWKTHPDDKAKWEVKDGTIVGSGGVGHLYSERDDYENFHYRVEAMINDKGNSGQYFRTQFAKGFPPGFEAQINATHGDPVKTGSLYNYVKIFKCPHKPNEWFTQEVIADGNHIVIKVNGETTVDTVIPNIKFTKGHFAIQQHDPGSVVKVRKIEYKPLPPTKSEGK